MTRTNRRTRLEVADIFRQHGEAYRRSHRLPNNQLRLMGAIERCRTASLGGHVEQCGQCGKLRRCYNSCRNRHCPKCGSLARARWLKKRRQELLPVDYFHVVFTVPSQLYPLFWRNQRILYDLLFRVSMETLLMIARDPKHLGAEIGMFGILHTWGQNLLYHPHIHYVVPGGGLAPSHDRWISTKPGFFLPVRVLSALFRNRFLSALLDLFEKEKLQFPAEIAPLNDRSCFRKLIDPLRSTAWVVYCKPPFGGPSQVLDYLGRYSNRVAISNDRLLSLNAEGEVSFRWKDYRHKHRQTMRVMSLDAFEFIRRFLLHSLPDAFQRIRSGGFLANRHRKSKLGLIRRLLAVADILPLLPLPQDPAAAFAHLTGRSFQECPACGRGPMLWIETLPPVRWRNHHVPVDSS